MHRERGRQCGEKVAPRDVRIVVLPGGRERYFNVHGRVDDLALRARRLQRDHSLPRMFRVGAAHRARARAAEVRGEVDERVAARQRLVREPRERIAGVHIDQRALGPLRAEPLRRGHAARKRVEATTIVRDVRAEIRPLRGG